ncbi:hypothetical protein WKK05_01595 [Nostoc sp. UHCC 0302]|uniref:hypothetical protein n=1 Tax=Nostoc sp. UHCC 0302 TaxID=3134896 RepID=UPI00311C9575
MPESKKLIFLINHLLVLTLVTSCGGKTPTENMLNEAQNVTSWAATANMVGDAWVRQAVPSTYAQQTLKKAQEELIKESGNIVQIKPSSDTTERYKSVLLADTLQLANTTKQISIAVTQKNRTLVQRQLRELATEARSLNQVKNNIKANE